MRVAAGGRVSRMANRPVALSAASAWSAREWSARDKLNVVATGHSSQLLLWCNRKPRSDDNPISGQRRPGKARHHRAQASHIRKHLKRKENALAVSFGFPSAQKTAVG